MCIFCKLINQEIPARIILENESFIAFLSPYPNTDGFTVIATKVHYDSYIFDLPNDVYHGMLEFAKEVGKLLDAALGVQRTGMICEGMGINHAHIKLVPMHGIPDGVWQPINSNIKTYFEVYQGYISSHDGPMQDIDNIKFIHQKILSYIENSRY